MIEVDFFEAAKPGAALAPLDKLLDMGAIRTTLFELERALQTKLKKKGSLDPTKELTNWVFMGPPGTGKTTVARAFGEVFKGLGLLGGGHVVEVRGNELQGTHLGQTGPVVISKFDEALGGVLFIDEAYALASGDLYTSQALQTIVALTTDKKYEGKLVVVLAGYHDDMSEMLERNPGLTGRFTEQLAFEEWPAKSCVEIVLKLCVEEGVAVGPDIHANLTTGFDKLKTLTSFASARDAKSVAKKLEKSFNARGGEGTVTAADVASAFVSISSLRKQLVVHGGGQGGPDYSRGGFSGGAYDISGGAPRRQEITHQASRMEHTVLAAEVGGTGVGGPSLELALRELKYSEEKALEASASRVPASISYPGASYGYRLLTDVQVSSNPGRHHDSRPEAGFLVCNLLV